jgi:glycosyltransferase involved in cell wall biosynthesis
LTEEAFNSPKGRPLQLSVLIPAFNEEQNLPSVFVRLNQILETLPKYIKHEIIVLDNASIDRTPIIAREFCRKDSRWKLLRYSRNFGVEASMTAGLDYASGDAVMFLFSDLQDPPELIPTFVQKWEEGFEVVVGSLRKRSDHRILKTIGAKIAYWMIYALSDCKIPANVTDFRLLDRKVVEAIRRLREPDRYLRGLIHWVGFRRTYVTYNRSERRGGKSTAGVWYSVRFALHAILCFSAKPLHLAILFGGFVIIGSFLFALLNLAVHFFRIRFIPEAPAGITTIVLLLTFFLGLNTMFLGIIGEYVGRIYNQGKNRPLYVVDEQVNLDSLESRVNPRRRRARHDN